MGRENEILVTPEILRQTAQNLKDLFQKGLKGYEEIEKNALETENCLKGKCAGRLRRRIITRKEKGSMKLQNLCAFPEKLLQIAEEYETAERENKNG